MPVLSVASPLKRPPERCGTRSWRSTAPGSFSAPSMPSQPCVRLAAGRLSTSPPFLASLRLALRPTTPRKVPCASLPKSPPSSTLASIDVVFLVLTRLVVLSLSSLPISIVRISYDEEGRSNANNQHPSCSRWQHHLSCPCSDERSALTISLVSHAQRRPELGKAA